ncbi:HAD-IB family phosphatase [Pleurocapsa sp. PCC 7319]|uniref:HAD-IB family phosphatase n=1 Tax=Pleurocapsa sp. PCC 7319 TaxID=118161 RepID=UPI00034971C1|nr:HAD-IB family phosphatase [Pleurocapsa sp. PCC 7319]
MKFSRVVFCDFDGTITTQDTFVTMVKKFAPEVSVQLLPMIFSRQITLKEGVRQTLESISTNYYPQIIEHTANQPIRPGLKDFLDFLNYVKTPCVIISGGLTDVVKALLERQQLINKIAGIYAGEVDQTGQYLRVYSSIESDTELVAKVKAMAKYPAIEKIAIGDSVTDINMALAADLVFARDRLTEYLDDEKKSYVQWQDFFDVRDYLASHWQIDF